MPYHTPTEVGSLLPRLIAGGEHMTESILQEETNNSYQVGGNLSTSVYSAYSCPVPDLVLNA